MKYIKRETGFTLIEFLIYIVILVIVIFAMGLVASNVFQIGVRNDVVQEVSHNGRFAIQRIGQAVRAASYIIEPGEGENEGNRLELSFEDLTKNPTVFDISSEGKLRIKEGNGDYIELTTSKVAVEQIIFKKVSEDSVKVELNISFYNPQGLPEYDFKSFFTSSFTLTN